MIRMAMIKKKRLTMPSAGENMQQLVLSGTSGSIRFYNHWQKELGIIY